VEIGDDEVRTADIFREMRRTAMVRTRVHASSQKRIVREGIRILKFTLVLKALGLGLCMFCTSEVQSCELLQATVDLRGKRLVP
jgi:hypothetical protein